MRIDARIEIKTVFTYSDTGYTSNMKLPEIEEWAKSKMRTLNVLLQEGGTEPKIVPASFSIIEIVFRPEDGKINV